MRRRFNSTRWQTWDYGWDGIYFITICTHNRVPYFGFIENGKMQLSAIGEEAELCVKNIPSHFPFARVSAFVVMPNHLHLLLITDKMGVFNESELTRFFEPINFESKKKDVVSSVIEGNEHVGDCLFRQPLLVSRFFANFFVVCFYAQLLNSVVCIHPALL